MRRKAIVVVSSFFLVASFSVKAEEKEANQEANQLLTKVAETMASSLDTELVGMLNTEKIRWYLGLRKEQLEEIERIESELKFVSNGLVRQRGGVEALSNAHKNAALEKLRLLSKKQYRRLKQIYLQQALLGKSRHLAEELELDGEEMNKLSEKLKAAEAKLKEERLERLFVAYSKVLDDKFGEGSAARLMGKRLPTVGSYPMLEFRN